VYVSVDWVDTGRGGAGIRLLLSANSFLLSSKCNWPLVASRFVVRHRLGPTFCTGFSFISSYFYFYNFFFFLILRSLADDSDSDSDSGSDLDFDSMFDSDSDTDSSPCHLVFKRLSTRPVHRVQCCVIVDVVVVSFSSLVNHAETHSFLGHSLRPLRLIYRLKTVCTRLAFT